jgi:TPR repeat protein
VVCSACGYENQVGHRFCGMCGMPLPHPPLTAPGANSTLNLTRVPLETGSGTQHSASGRTGVLTEIPHSGDSQAAGSRDSDTSTQTTMEAPDNAGEASGAARSTVSSTEPPPKELVPDLPLDEYVKSFHYEPPNDATEITMRCDAPVQDAPAARRDATIAEAAAAAADAAATSVTASDGTAPSALAADTGAISKSTSEPDPISEVAAAVSADVDSRLGLEPEAPAEARIERPRFLDINEPPPETKPATSGTSTIVGPSFLGLSDASEDTAEPSVLATEDAEPGRGRWRLWLAVAIVLIFGVLGAMEWRAQRSQTGNGPVEVIQAKIRDLRHQNPSQAGSEPAAPATSGDNTPKPEMQAQDQSKPAAQDKTIPATGPATSAANSSSSPAAPHTNAAAPALNGSSKAPMGSQSVAGQTPGVPPKPAATTGIAPAVIGENARSNPPSANAAKPAPSQETPQPAMEKPKPAPPAPDNQEVTVKQPALGADEMAKAKNASDSAAQAAWLWKATAKGNSDAPVQLADMYVKGDGVPRSCEQAVVLLKTAAEKENARARNRLAAMYATGNCVPRNRVEAYRWLSSALTANPNSQWALQNRDLLWQQMTPEERGAAQRYR